MPDPVFRSSEGRTPKTAKNYVDPDDIDTASPDFFEADTDETDTKPAVDQDDIDTETPDGPTRAIPSKTYNERPPKNTVRPSVPPKTGGCAKTFGVMAGLIGFSVAAIIGVIVYFLFFYGPGDSTF